MELISGVLIKDALHRILPKQIAVAYVGADWRQYICDQSLKEIILSPTLGSNPRAIIKIVESLGWDNVYFLDNLHAKIYIGETMAAVGSFNLSANGLSGEGLEEAGFVVKASETINQLLLIFESFKSLAVAQYRSKAEKIKQLKELQTLHNKAISEKLIRNDRTQTLVQNYTPLSDDDFYVCWARGSVTYNKENITQSIPAATPDKFDEVVHDCLSFLESDYIQKHRWILYWTANNNGLPNKRSQPHWLHIDELVSCGAVDQPYTKLAIERADKERPPYPFELGTDEIKAIRAVLCSNRFPEFLDNSTENWSIGPTLPRFREFINAVKDEVLGLDQDAKKVSPTLLLTENILPGKLIRSVLPNVLALASDVLPKMHPTGIGKVASWAAHLILAESGHPLNYVSSRDGESGGTATTEWISSRVGQVGKDGRERTLRVLSAFADSASFGPSVQHWAKRAQDKFLNMDV